MGSPGFGFSVFVCGGFSLLLEAVVGCWGNTERHDPNNTTTASETCSEGTTTVYVLKALFDFIAATGGRSLRLTSFARVP